MTTVPYNYISMNTDTQIHTLTYAIKQTEIHLSKQTNKIKQVKLIW